MTRNGQTLITSEPVLHQLKTALRTDERTRAIRDFARVLRDSSARYTWVGIYLVKGDKLVLEAYSGDAETEHVSISIGQGICGAAAKQGETIVVPDVSKDPRYLMCFPSTRSEIVVPIMTRSEVLGEIDIDSDKLAAFSRADEGFLEEAANLLARFLQKD